MSKFKEMNEMLDNVVSKTNGMRYICRSIHGRVALIESKTINGMPKGWEVWIVRTRSVKDIYNPSGLWYPSNEDFGRYGWSFSSREDAEAKFDSMRCL